MVHTTLSDSVKLTWSITDDQGWSVVCLSLSDCLNSLCRVCTKSDLCYIYIAIAHSDLCKRLLADLLTGSSELTNLTDVGSLRCLSTCIRIHLCIEYHNVYILTGCKYMVETTKSDIVCPTVTTEDPYRLLRKIILLSKYCLRLLTATLLELSDQCFGRLNVCLSVILCLKVFIDCSLNISGCIVRCCDLFQSLDSLVTKILLTYIHTKTMLCVILEQ